MTQDPKFPPQPAVSVEQAANEAAERMWRIHPNDLDRMGYVHKSHGGKHDNPRAAYYASEIIDVVKLALAAAPPADGAPAGFVLVPVDDEARTLIGKAADFLDSAAGEGLELGGIDAMGLVTEMHALLVEDSNNCFHEDVRLWLRGKIMPMVPEDAAPKAPTAPIGEVSAPGADGLKSIGHDLAMAAGNLVVATDGQEAIRAERIAVLNALKAWEKTLADRAQGEGEKAS